jgi:hypothetical protein
MARPVYLQQQTFLEAAGTAVEWPEADSRTAANNHLRAAYDLFDHLVGEGEQRRRRLDGGKVASPCRTLRLHHGDAATRWRVSPRSAQRTSGGFSNVRVESASPQSADIDRRGRDSITSSARTLSLLAHTESLSR